jgi:hypothetical protein
MSAWLAALPSLAGYFLKGAADLVVVGLSTVLIGRAIRMYFERDVRLLRNAALIVSVIWSRMIFNGAADVLIDPANGLPNIVFFSVVGILIAVASLIVIMIIHRSAKGFFVKSKSEANEFEES